MRNRKIHLLLGLLSFAISASVQSDDRPFEARSDEPTAADLVTPTTVVTNGHFLVKTSGGAIVALHCDARGTNQHGPNLLARDGIRLDNGQLQVAVDGARLKIGAENSETAQLHWSLPFQRSGFYDADTHRSYASADSMEWQAHRELFRKFVGGSGHAKYVEELKRVGQARSTGRSRRR